jgi:hypothetical protein
MLEKNEDYYRTDRVRNEEMLHRVKEERNIIHTVKEKVKDYLN